MEVITSSLENTGNTWLGCNTPGVVICWAGDEHLSSSLGVVCKEAVKQMLAKGTASSRVDLSSDGTFIRVSYVPIISGERLIAVLQLPESRPDRVLDEQLLIKNVESMVTSTADLMANGSVDMNSNSTPYFKFSTMISSLLRGIPPSQSSILRESGARISESLSGLLNLDVCIAIKEASSGFYCGKLYGSNVTAIENIHFVSQDFLSRIGSDLGVSVYPSAFISSGSNNREVYQLVRKFEAEDAIIIIESQDRMPAMAVHCVNFLVSTIEFACQAHLTERRKKSYENKLAFEQYSKTLRAARDEQSLLQLLNSKLHEVLTVRKSCVITISREEQLGEDMILKGTNKEEDFSSFSLQRIAAHCLSSDTNIVCEKGESALVIIDVFLVTLDRI